MTKQRGAAPVTLPDLLAPDRDPLDLLEALVALDRERLEAASASLILLTGHADSDVRLQAHRRLLVHLKSVAHHPLAVSALKSDADSEVRRVAAFGVATTSSTSTFDDDARLLAQVVRDERETAMVRGAAYEALLLLVTPPRLQPISRDVDLEQDVDWEWVNSLAAMRT